MVLMALSPVFLAGWRANCKTRHLKEFFLRGRQKEVQTLAIEGMMQVSKPHQRSPMNTATRKRMTHNTPSSSKGGAGVEPDL